MLPNEIKDFITKTTKEEVEKYKAEISELRALIEQLKIDIAIVRQGGNL